MAHGFPWHFAIFKKPRNVIPTSSSPTTNPQKSMAQPTDPYRTTASNNGEVFGGELPHYTQLMQVGDPQKEVSETFGNEAVSLGKDGERPCSLDKPTQ